jgi:hypothetical protein
VIGPGVLKVDSIGDSSFGGATAINCSQNRATLPGYPEGGDASVADSKYHPYRILKLNFMDMTNNTRNPIQVKGLNDFGLAFNCRGM